MRRGQANEFSGRDLGFLPESREMLLIARYRIVRTGQYCTAFQKHIVVKVAWDIQAAGRNDRMTVVFDKLQQL